jgi:hypothetical protein
MSNQVPDVTISDQRKLDLICVYVKTKDAGLRRVCVPCADNMLKMPDRILPMQTKDVF